MHERTNLWKITRNKGYVSWHIANNPHPLQVNISHLPATKKGIPWRPTHFMWHCNNSGQLNQSVALARTLNSHSDISATYGCLIQWTIDTYRHSCINTLEQSDAYFNFIPLVLIHSARTLMHETHEHLNWKLKPKLTKINRSDWELEQSLRYLNNSRSKKGVDSITIRPWRSSSATATFRSWWRPSWSKRPTINLLSCYVNCSDTSEKVCCRSMSLYHIIN